MNFVRFGGASCGRGGNWLRVVGVRYLSETGYKVFRYVYKEPVEALTDPPPPVRADPGVYGHQLPHRGGRHPLPQPGEPYWGARKIRDVWPTRFSCEVRFLPQHHQRVLDRHGLCNAAAQRTMLRARSCLWGKTQLAWRTDSKANSGCGNKKTLPSDVPDHASRYLLLLKLWNLPVSARALRPFARLFKERCGPAGQPAGPSAMALPLRLATLCSPLQLSVWVLRLGITIERTPTRSPQAEWPATSADLTLKTEPPPRSLNSSAAANHTRYFSRGVQQRAAATRPST